MDTKRTKEVVRLRRLSTCIVLAPLLVFCTGCPFGTLPTDGNQTARPNLDTPGNATIASATALPLGEGDGEVEFVGTIDGRSDVDVYDIGVLRPGDRLLVDVRTTSGTLDPVAAIFDGDEYLIAYNDDRASDSSDLNPYLDFVIRGDEGHYYLGVVGYPGYDSNGNYDAIVTVQRDVGVPVPDGQIVYLDWAGGSGAVVPNVGTFDLQPFDASDVGLASSQTASLKDRVQAVVAERYADFNFVVLNSDDDPVPAGAHSTVYFGGLNRQAFAISEKIDSYNSDPSDSAIVYTESFIGAFGARPSFERMGQALGNTVAHEIAHLLGLVHTADCEDLMDATCSNVRILSPQEFSTAQVDDSVFPFGYQPAVDILTWVLGLVGQ